MHGRSGEYCTLGRTVPFLVAKALNFKIRENLCLFHVFCVRVASFASALRLLHSRLSCSRLFEDCCVFPHCVNRKHSCQMCKRRKRRNADEKDATQMRLPSSAQSFLRIVRKGSALNSRFSLFLIFFGGFLQLPFHFCYSIF